MAPPRFQIPAHVFSYGLALTPAVAYGVYYQRNKPSDEDLQETLKKNYSANIEANKAKRSDMVNFVNKTREGSSGEENENRMQEILKGGKGDIKRKYAVDKKLYGTQQGLEEKKRTEQEITEKKEQKKNKNKKLKKLGDGSSNKLEQTLNATKQDNISVVKPKDAGKPSEQQQEQQQQLAGPTTNTGLSPNTQSALTLASVGLLAAAVGFLAGGGRSSQ